MLAVIQKGGQLLIDRHLMGLLLRWRTLVVAVAALVALFVFTGLVCRFISRTRRLRSAPSGAGNLQALKRGQTFARGIPTKFSVPAEGPYLIERLRAIESFQFEQVIAATYRKLGFNVIRRGGANPDGGIDLIIERQGVQTAVQCKQWRVWNVGLRPVR